MSLNNRSIVFFLFHKVFNHFRNYGCPYGIWWATLVEWYKQLVIPLEFGIIYTNMKETTHIGVWKNNWGMQSKMVFEICERISCSPFYVKEFDIIVHKKYFPYITILYPKSLANLVVEVGTRHTHQTLLVAFYQRWHQRLPRTMGWL